MSDKTSGIEINVIRWTSGEEQISMVLHDFDQMLTFSAESARSIAFLLMECADHVDPPIWREQVDEEEE